MSDTGFPIPWNASETDIKNQIKALEAARGLKPTGKIEAIKAMRGD